MVQLILMDYYEITDGEIHIRRYVSLVGISTGLAKPRIGKTELI